MFQRQRRVIPFDRVQDIAIERGLLARLFGTARVKIETGGAAKDEGELDMIALADAHALRDQIRRGAARRGGAEAATPAAEPVLFAMDLPRLLLSGLFGFSLVFLAAIAAVVQQLDQFDLVDWERLVHRRARRGGEPSATVQIGLILGVLIVLAGIVAGRGAHGAARFRLPADPDRGRPAAPARALHPVGGGDPAAPHPGRLDRERPGRPRCFGWYRLSFQTLGADRKEGGVQVAAPFARMDEILPILAEAGFPAPPPRADLPRRPAPGAAAPGRALARAGAGRGGGRLAVRPVAPRIAAIAFVLLGLAAMLRWRSPPSYARTPTRSMSAAAC